MPNKPPRRPTNYNEQHGASPAAAQRRRKAMAPILASTSPQQHAFVFDAPVAIESLASVQTAPAILKPADPAPAVGPEPASPPFVQDGSQDAAVHIVAARRYSQSTEHSPPPLAPRTGSAHDQPTTVELSGRIVAGAAGLGVAAALPSNWDGERVDALLRLGQIELLLREIAPLVQEVEASRRAGLGHNRPPEAIEDEPLGTADLKIGISAANVGRTQLSQERPDLSVIRLCGLVLERVGAKVAATLSWIADKRDDFEKGFAQGAGRLAAKEILPRLPQLLHEAVQQIQHLLQALGITW